MDKYLDGEISGDEPSLENEAKVVQSKKNEQICYFLDKDRKSCLFFDMVGKANGGRMHSCIGYNSVIPLMDFPEKLFTEYAYQDYLAECCVAYCDDSSKAQKIVEGIKKGLENLIVCIEEKRLNKC